MEEQIISFIAAKLANEKGFKSDTFWIYNKETEQCSNKWIPNGIAAPTQSLLQKWLREEYNIQVMVTSHNYAWGVFVENTFTPYKWIHNFNSYESALEQGLLEALKLIK